MYIGHNETNAINSFAVPASTHDAEAHAFVPQSTVLVSLKILVNIPTAPPIGRCRYCQTLRDHPTNLHIHEKCGAIELHHRPNKPTGVHQSRCKCHAQQLGTIHGRLWHSMGTGCSWREYRQAGKATQTRRAPSTPRTVHRNSQVLV